MKQVKKDQNKYRLDREPSTIVRFGTGIIFLIFLLGLILASGISFNEVITGEVLVTTKNPPVKISAKNNGEIISLPFRNGESVEEGTVMAVLRNSAIAADVEYLKRKITEEELISSSVDSIALQFPVTLRVGSSIQPFYNRFLSAYLTAILHNELEESEIFQKQKSSLLYTQSNLINYKRQQINEAAQNLAAKKVNLDRNEGLLKKGIISTRDFEEIEIDYRNQKQQDIILEQEYEELVLDLKHFQNDLESSNINDIKNENFQQATLMLARQELFSKILEWEENYLLKSPINGKITYHEIWANHQKVNEGEIVFSVIPLEKETLIGKCLVPVMNSGKVFQGQEVIIKLENYPFKEWGTVRGTVQSISDSEIQSRDGYLVYLTLEDLKTSYGKQLVLNQELIGTAEILLEEVSLLERIFYQFRYLLSDVNF